MPRAIAALTGHAPRVSGVPARITPVYQDRGHKPVWLGRDGTRPDVGLRRLHREALRMRAGRVGDYPVSAFIHVDVGPVRRW